MAKKQEKAIAPRRAGGLSTNVKWKQQLAELAAEDAAREPAGGGNAISTRGHKFTLGGSVIPNPMRVIVLDYSFENAYYAEAYDPDSPASPSCFAVAKKEQELAPDSEKVPEPVSEACDGCPNNEFGSADSGRGKACKNGRKLAVISADVKELTPEYVAETAVAFIRVSPSGIKHWSGYVKKLKNALDAPVCGVITELDFDPDSDQPVLTMQYLEEINDGDVLEAVLKRRAEVQDDLLAGFQAVSDRPTKREKPVKRAAEKRATAKPAKKGAAARGRF